MHLSQQQAVQIILKVPTNLNDFLTRTFLMSNSLSEGHTEEEALLEDSALALTLFSMMGKVLKKPADRSLVMETAKLWMLYCEHVDEESLVVAIPSDPLVNSFSAVVSLLSKEIKRFKENQLLMAIREMRSHYHRA